MALANTTEGCPSSEAIAIIARLSSLLAMQMIETTVKVRAAGQ